LKSLNEAMKLYIVTDVGWRDEENFSIRIEETLKNGATMFQLREKNAPWKSYAVQGKIIRDLCRRYRVPFIVNDDIAGAKELDADGVHVGQLDGSPIEARRILGTGKIVGVSVTTVEEALLAEKQGADYLGVGAVFSTRSKEDADFVTLPMLAEICGNTALPVVAIGGINKVNMDILKDTGVDGVAVISAVFGQDDVASATRELRLKLDSWHPNPPRRSSPMFL